MKCGMCEFYLTADCPMFVADVAVHPDCDACTPVERLEAIKEESSAVKKMLELHDALKRLIAAAEYRSYAGRDDDEWDEWRHALKSAQKALGSS